MNDKDSMTAEELLSDETFKKIFAQDDPVEQARMIMELEERSAKLGVKTKFKNLYRAYKKSEDNKKNNGHDRSGNCTSFSGQKNLKCGRWIAGDSGIYAQSYGGSDERVTFQPIFPVGRYVNTETGEEKITIKYKTLQGWNNITVDRGVISSSKKIVELSQLGLDVTTENAKMLVRYLSDIINLNGDKIPFKYSSSKLGWYGDNDFLFPCGDDNRIFDGGQKFRDVSGSIKEHGSKDEWYDHVRDLRKAGRIEIKFMMAASFASVMIGYLDSLPFVADLWGETEGGKTVTLMLAASIWANPAETKYIGDFKTTPTAAEMKADMLNNLPVIMDDSSNTKKNEKFDFESSIYNWCNGKGKSRSNINLGINRENRWKCAFLTTGEKPLTSYVTSGGAINRVLELRCGREAIYKNPQETVQIIKNNYGFAGRDFIDALRSIGRDKIRRHQIAAEKQLFDAGKMRKQSISLATILVADAIATQYLFKDGCYISVDEITQVLSSRAEVSDNERCYQYILSAIDINAAKFNPSAQTGEAWGVIENGYAVIYNNIFDRLCEDGGFSRKSFVAWAKEEGIIDGSGGKTTKSKRIQGEVKRCVFLKMIRPGEPDKDGIVVDNNGFVTLSDDSDGEQIDLPFS